MHASQDLDQQKGTIERCSTVALSDSLDLVLLPDSGGVATDALGGGDDFVSEAFGKGLVAAEGRLARVLAHKEDRLVDSAERGDVDGLSADGTAGADTGGVLTSASLHDGLEEDGERVLAGEQVHDLEGLLEVANGHLLLTVDAAIPDHELVDEPLNDGAGDFLEPLLLVLAGGVGAQRPEPCPS